MLIPCAALASSAFEKHVVAVIWAQEKLTPRSGGHCAGPCPRGHQHGARLGPLRPPWVSAKCGLPQAVQGQPQRSPTAPSPGAGLCAPRGRLQHEYAALNTRRSAVPAPAPCTVPLGYHALCGGRPCGGRTEVTEFCV